MGHNLLHAVASAATALINHAQVSATAEWWPPDPLTLASLLAVAGLYLSGVRARPRSARALIGRWRMAAFAIGMTALVVALVSPLDARAEEAFAVHMMQHLLLGVLAPPLLLAGRPAQVITWALPPDWARRGARLHGRVLRIGAGAPWLPVVGLAIYAATWWAWHVPVLYEAAVRTAAVHALEHGMMLAAGLLLVAPIVHPRRIAAGAGPLLLLGAAIQGGLLGVLLTFSPSPWYEVGVSANLASALADQQVGGAIMWVFGGVAYVLAAAYSLAQWLRDDERTSDRADARRWKGVDYAR